jgi:hypothetical protein
MMTKRLETPLGTSGHAEPKITHVDYVSCREALGAGLLWAALNPQVTTGPLPALAGPVGEELVCEPFVGMESRVVTRVRDGSGTSRGREDHHRRGAGRVPRASAGGSPKR